ncbi:hypothetical protein CCACVL1_06903 [Corchorus capsularis]|uniref:Uncharacterized protein n=1 Tax=Corchorus capsularis TaxID=210143 RepID=A0A1R3JBL9_COCAP|nr:hypothetical protein CCACVL1_06903 [Corchorus capsularis]
MGTAQFFPAQLGLTLSIPNTDIIDSWVRDCSTALGGALPCM